MTSDVEEKMFGMKCMFEMKRKDLRRNNQNCKRMSGMEYGKKGCKKHTSSELRNKSDHLQMAADCKKMKG